MCNVKLHLQVWSQRSTVTTSHSTLRPHHHQQEERKTILQSDTSFHSRYIINRDARWISAVQMMNKQQWRRENKYVYFCFNLPRTGNRMLKCSRKKRFSLGHFGQILTKPHKKCSEKCWLELYKQSWFIKMSSGHSSAFERKNLSSAASGGGSSSHSSLLASLRSRAASHSSRIHQFWHQY